MPIITKQNWNSSEYVIIRITPSRWRGQKSPPGFGGTNRLPLWQRLPPKGAGLSYQVCRLLSNLSNFVGCNPSITAEIHPISLAACKRNGVEPQREHARGGVPPRPPLDPSHNGQGGDESPPLDAPLFAQVE